MPPSVRIAIMPDGFLDVGDVRGVWQATEIGDRGWGQWQIGRDAPALAGGLRLDCHGVAC